MTYNPNIAHIDPNIAHIEAQDGTVFQVLNEASDDWDEAATRAEYDTWLAEQSEPQPIVVEPEAAPTK